MNLLLAQEQKVALELELELVLVLEILTHNHQMKLRAEQEVEHLPLREVQAQANDAERAREADHAQLVDKEGVVFVMVMIVCHGFNLREGSSYIRLSSLTQTRLNPSPRAKHVRLEPDLRQRVDVSADDVETGVPN